MKLDVFSPHLRVHLNKKNRKYIENLDILMMKAMLQCLYMENQPTVHLQLQNILVNPIIVRKSTVTY